MLFKMILIGALVFLIIILLLVGLLLFAKLKLTASGSVRILINGEKEISSDSGYSLLSTLSNNNLFLASACGGKGTCGMCRCQVVSGGGMILPTESNFFTRKQQHENWRLGCMVKVKQDISIRLPQSVMGVKKWMCTVVSNRNVAPFIKEFIIRLPEGEKLDFRPGEYIQVDVPPCRINFFTDIQIEPEYRDEWSQYKLWELQMNSPEPVFRAYSMANYPAEGNVIRLNVRIATPPVDHRSGEMKKVNPGICSSYIFSRKPGDQVSVSGPYGDFHIRDTDREMIYIGGGAGMAPLRSHLLHLFRTLKTDRKVSFWYGARSKKEIFYAEDFYTLEKEFPNFRFCIALSEAQPEDNWNGPTGFIHQALIDHYLASHPEPEEIEYYLCGPPLMNQAVKKMIYDFGIPEEMLGFDDFGG